MKRLLALVLSFILCLIVFSGCGKTPSETENEPSTGIQETSEVYYINGKEFEPDDYDWQEIESLFLEDYGATDDTYKVIDSSELSEEIISNRKGTVLIERSIGYVTDAETGDGEVLNAYDKDFNYISYNGCSQEYVRGTAILTYLVYNSENNYIDDIIERYDFVLTDDFAY